MSEPIDPRRRIVRFLDERDLLMAAHARLADRRLCLAVNPASAFREMSPANVIAFDGGRILWALPLDFGRLALVPTTRPAAQVFDAFWTLVERSLGGPPEGPATVWFSPTGVGDQPERHALGDVASGPWVEYRGARPWVELGTVGGLRLLVPSNKPNDSASSEPDRAYRMRVLAAAVQPAANTRALQRRDSMIELSHFAILDPGVEGWTREGLIEAGALADLRLQFLRWAAG
ncbi:MAG: hypothetical protein ACYDAN_14510 [Candidatus Limnocylindrales bacterium]